MREFARIAAAASLGALVPLVFAQAAMADPVRSPNSIVLQMSCGGNQSALYVSPASGSAVMMVNGTQNTITFALTVNDPLNEIGGSFSVPLTSGVPLTRLTECTGAVVGTQAVTFTALSLVTPAAQH
jgi:hypothetical protein